MVHGVLSLLLSSRQSCVVVRLTDSVWPKVTQEAPWPSGDLNLDLPDLNPTPNNYTIQMSVKLPSWGTQVAIVFLGLQCKGRTFILPMPCTTFLIVLLCSKEKQCKHTCLDLYTCSQFLLAGKTAFKHALANGSVSHT